MLAYFCIKFSQDQCFSLFSLKFLIYFKHSFNLIVSADILTMIMLKDVLLALIVTFSCVREYSSSSGKFFFRSLITKISTPLLLFVSSGSLPEKYRVPFLCLPVQEPGHFSSRMVWFSNGFLFYYFEDSSHSLLIQGLLGSGCRFVKVSCYSNFLGIKKSNVVSHSLVCTHFDQLLIF